MGPTRFPELNGVLSDLVHRMHAVLGTSFVGCYLQGSFAVGDADEHSDVDWVAVVESELTPLQVKALQHMHASVFELESYWAQHLEGSYFPREVLRDPSMHGRDLWYLDNGASSLVRSSHCNTILVRWVVREMGVILEGPPPSSLVGPIPAAVLREEIAADIMRWGRHILDNPSSYANEFYQKYIALNFARMLHDLHRGRAGSKRAGHDWAKAHLDPSWGGLLDSTWEGRPRPEDKVRQPADAEEYDRTLSFVGYVMDECRKYTERKGMVMSGSHLPEEDRAGIRQAIEDSIGWAITKDFDLLYSRVAQDGDFFIFHPDSGSTIRGFQSFREHVERLFSGPSFRATRFRVKDLRVVPAACGSVAWYSCLLDDFGEWNGVETGWEDARWTGVLEKRNGAWVIAQMHFSFPFESD